MPQTSNPSPGAPGSSVRTWLVILLVAAALLGIGATFVAVSLNHSFTNEAQAKDKAPTTHPASTRTEKTAPTTKPTTVADATKSGPDAGAHPTTPPRGAIPLEGEKFDKPIPAKRLTNDQPEPKPEKTDKPAKEKSPTTAPTSTISWEEAEKHAGEVVTVEGRIADTHDTGSVCFLNFNKTRTGFYAIIFKKALSDWPDRPEKYFMDKTIRVTGKIYMQKDRPQIRVEDKSQIEVVTEKEKP